MKKFNNILSILLCVLVSVLFVACSDAGAPDHAVDNNSFVVTAQSLEEKTKEFAELEDRTTYTNGEIRAAEYLQNKLVEYGYDDAEIKDFSLVDNERHVDSRNVSAVYRPQEVSDNAKNVIIGAYYDNRYGATAGYNGVKSTGALGNCTGVAATLAIAEYLKENMPNLDYTVTIVFFGAGAITTYGAEYYYRGMQASERANTVLMIELQKLGMEHVYAFSDERKTKREAFFDEVAANNKLDIYKATQRSPIVSGISALEGVPYYRWVHSGIFTTFFNSGIPTLNIIGGDWETLDVTDNDRITVTEKDTYRNLVDEYPNYAEKIATAVSLVIRSLETDGFLQTMQYDRDNFPDTDVLKKNWIWYLVVLCVTLLGMLAVNLINMHLSKKYVIVPPAPKTVKMAVFGMDYEDKNSADIFIDVRNASSSEEIFPGIPNNDESAQKGDPFDPFVGGGAPIFPFGTPVQTEQSAEKRERIKPSDEPHAEPDDTQSENASSDDSVRLEIPDTKDNASSDSADVSNGKSDTEQTAEEKKDNAQAPKPKEKRTTGKSASGTGAKRKTVSAGKSVHDAKPEENSADDNSSQDGKTGESK